jgi:hypothetical protein
MPAMSGTAQLTKNGTVNCSDPVFTKAKRQPHAAAEETPIVAFSSVELTALTDEAVISGPKLNLVVEPKCVFCPTITTGIPLLPGGA